MICYGAHHNPLRIIPYTIAIWESIIVMAVICDILIILLVIIIIICDTLFLVIILMCGVIFVREKTVASPS